MKPADTPEIKINVYVPTVQCIRTAQKVGQSLFFAPKKDQNAR